MSLDRRSRRELVDREWSRDSVSKIKDVVESPGVRGEVVEATCASTMCRVVVQYAKDNDQVEFPRLVASKEPFNHGALYYNDPSTDRKVTTAYVAREGYDFVELAKE